GGVQPPETSSTWFQYVCGQCEPATARSLEFDRARGAAGSTLSTSRRSGHPEVPQLLPEESRLPRSRPDFGILQARRQRGPGLGGDTVLVFSDVCPDPSAA